MANNYLQFSECVADLTPDEVEWWQRATEYIEVFHGQELGESEDRPDAEPEYVGLRGLREATGKLGCGYYEAGFQYEICREDDDGLPHLWLYAEECGNVEQVAALIQQFLKRFRPHECFTLTYAGTCSKPRVGEFGGGAVVVTADYVRWHDAHTWADREKNDFAARQIGRPDEFVDAGPTIVLNMHGGLVQDVFCQSSDADVVIVDWDVEDSDPDSPGLVELTLNGKPVRAAVFMSEVYPLTALLGTDVEKAIQAARREHILAE